MNKVPKINEIYIQILISETLIIKIKETQKLESKKEKIIVYDDIGIPNRGQHKWHKSKNRRSLKSWEEDDTIERLSKISDKVLQETITRIFK